MTEDKERFLLGLDDLAEKSRALEAGEISVKEYKSVSCGFGSYLQRGGAGNMVRLRIPGGRLSRIMLRGILDACERNQVSVIKFSTGQSIQLHDVTPEGVRSIPREVLDIGIVTCGAGGDHPANVIASPLSGVEVGEHFDVMPYAEAVGDYIVSIVGRLKFPRKLKISFSNSPKNETHTTFRDLGFSANADGTFDVYAAGGLGVSPKMGILVREHVAPSKILYDVAAMFAVFQKYGNYEKRYQARTRYLQETLGPEVLKEKLLAHIEKLERIGAMDIDPEPYQVLKKGTGELEPRFRLYAQKQKGLYAVYFHPAGGYTTAARLEELYEATIGMESVEFRISPDGGLYIINCNAEEAEKLYQLTEDDSANTRFEMSVSCVGKARCTIGACDSQKLLNECLEQLTRGDVPYQVLPKIHISGCMSSCSSHQAAALGFRGTMKRGENGPEEAYAVSFGGREELHNEQLAESDAFLFARRIPEFLKELAQIVEKSGTVYDEWILTHEAEMKALVERYQI